MKIWEKYFLKEAAKFFLLFTFCFYGIYALIDFSSRSGSFNHYHMRFDWLELATYYSSEFVNRSEVLIPFALLLATVRTLCKLNQNNELVALMASGIRLRTLLRPFLLLGLLFTALMYLNNEFLLPLALEKLKHIDNAQSTAKKPNDTLGVQHVALEDGTIVLFQKFDSVRNHFFDAYWVKSESDIYRIKYLYPYAEPPAGHYVDHITRNKNGHLTVAGSQAVKAFTDIKFNKQLLLETITLPEELPISKLWEKLPPGHEAQSEKEARIVSSFYRKVCSPWLCLFAVIGPAPFCVRFSRQFPVFLIYAASIFGLVAIFLVIDAVHVLGRRQVMDPMWAILPPFILLFAVFGWRYARLR